MNTKMEQKKQCYVAPEVTVVKFAIERGLALSGEATNTDYQQGNNWNLPYEGNNTTNYTDGNDWGTF